MPKLSADVSLQREIMLGIERMSIKKCIQRAALEIPVA